MSGAPGYSEAVRRRFQAPRHVGPLSGAAVAEAGRLADGCLIRLWLKGQDGRIDQAAFRAFGCPAAIACGDWLAEWLAGRTRAEAGALTGLEIAHALALAADKTGVALVAEDALKAALAALDQYEG